MDPAVSILIVEDSETQALKLRFLLEEEGWEVMHAATAEAALDQLTQRLPSLIIADSRLPAMQGCELCRKVRATAATSAIPLVLFTAEESSACDACGLGGCADQLVSKTIAPELLLAQLRALLAVRAAGLASPALSPQEAYFRRARILAIDDSPTYLQNLVEAFNNAGYAVVGASGAREGLALAARQPFDCIMVDLVMPEIDGIEVCRRITEISRATGHSMSVLMLTSSDSTEDMTRGLEAGADDFVAKSNDITVLRARIRALLRRNFYQEENHQIRERLIRSDLEASEARVVHRLSETRAALIKELEQKNKELEAFSYSVSHDLRAPLRIIEGFSKALQDEHSAAMDADGRRHLARVRAAAGRMAELIDDLLKLSRVGRADLQRRPVNLASLAREVAVELQSVSPGRTVDVLIADTVMADADHRLLRLLLENLLGNAWKFTAAVTPAVVELGVLMLDSLPTYFIRDNGAGFDMAHAGRLFTPFQRLHSQADFPGTGIGLATVHRIVERHGGRVWAESSIGQGATFLWTLPPQLSPNA